MSAQLSFLVIVNIIGMLLLFIISLYMYAYFAHADDSSFAQHYLTKVAIVSFKHTIFFDIPFPLRYLDSSSYCCKSSWCPSTLQMLRATLATI